MQKRIVLLCTLVLTFLFIPILDLMLFRSVGDEKVHLSQAIEMAREGHWFVQSLNGDPNYYKGPLYYQLIQIGLLVFGNSPLAGLYMNLIGAVLMSCSLILLFRQQFPNWTHSQILFAALAPNLTVASLAFISSSQMEFLLISFYTSAMAPSDIPLWKIRPQ